MTQRLLTNEVLGERLDNIHADVTTIKEALETVIRLEERQLTLAADTRRLDERANRHDLRLNMLEAALPILAAVDTTINGENGMAKRLNSIEIRVPQLIETRVWLMGLFAAAGSAFIAGVISGFIHVGRVMVGS